MLQENKARQIFRKTNISYPLVRIVTPILRFSPLLYYQRIIYFTFQRRIQNRVKLSLITSDYASVLPPFKRKTKNNDGNYDKDKNFLFLLEDS